MANDTGHGGPRTPANPAPVSGPGALSRRTDGRPNVMDLPDAEYGDGQAFREMQTGAQMGAGPQAATPAGGTGGVDPSGLVPLDAPTGRPDEAVTAGSPVGPGVGPDAIGLGPKAEEGEDLDRLRRYLPALVEMANRADSTASFRNYVRLVRSKVS